MSSRRKTRNVEKEKPHIFETHNIHVYVYPRLPSDIEEMTKINSHDFVLFDDKCKIAKKIELRFDTFEEYNIVFRLLRLNKLHLKVDLKQNKFEINYHVESDFLIVEPEKRTSF